MDIQGLRTIAVTLVVLDHLFGWPHGGFIGVDVFFVVSGFLITGILLRGAEQSGHVSFLDFYRKRVRRIFPAAAITLLAIVACSSLLFNGPRASSTWIDAVTGFLFVSNWRFALNGTDYFTESGPISPVRHFWSLSVEEQFYFVWPVLIALIVYLAAKRKLDESKRKYVFALVMAAISVSSFTWAFVSTEESPTWAYFSTLTRAWELGAGALIAIFAPNLHEIPNILRPLIAWFGIALIFAGSMYISEDVGFPGPWAAVPVVGASLVIASGTGSASRYLAPITNKVSAYIGNISYSLYLWHWPVIIFLGSYTDYRGVYYYIAAIGLMTSLSIASYTFIEDPIRGSSWLKPKETHLRQRRTTLSQKIKKRMTFRLNRPRALAGLGALTALVFGLSGLAFLPITLPMVPPLVVTQTSVDSDAAPLGPETDALQAQLRQAVSATDWPTLAPSMDDAISGPQAPDPVAICGGVEFTVEMCTFGTTNATRRALLVGDSVAMTYANPLRLIAESPQNDIQLTVMSMFGCPFVDYEINLNDADRTTACNQRKRDAVAFAEQIRPNFVILSNFGGPYSSLNQWEQGISGILDQFAPAAGQLVIVGPTPNLPNPSTCYTPASVPANCLGSISKSWFEVSDIEKRVIRKHGGIWVDSRLWFCTADRFFCPAFAGGTPTRKDQTHMTPQYGEKIIPTIVETLLAAQVGFVK